MRRLLCAAARRQDRLKEFCIMPVYPMDIAGLHRELPICKVTDDLYIGAFICFGDAELTVACARDMLAMLEADSYDYLFTAEAKSIPLIHEMARQSGAKKYFIARKGPKAYMPDPIHVEDKSITTAGVQKLYLGRDDADLIRGKRIVLMDDVISTGGSLHAMEELVKMAYEAGIEVTSLPGACACVTALTLSGLSTRRFVFEAFLPPDKKEHKLALERLKNETRTMIVYEAPHHLLKTLWELLETLGNRRLTLCR